MRSLCILEPGMVAGQHTIPYYHIQIIPKRANAKPFSTITPQITLNVHHTPVYLETACLEQEPTQYHTIPEHAGHTISYKQQNIRSHNIPHQATLNHTNKLITSSLPGYSLSPPAAPQAYPILPYRIIPHHIALHHTKPYHYS
jgi:hypothetical protein